MSEGPDALLAEILNLQEDPPFDEAAFAAEVEAVLDRPGVPLPAELTGLIWTSPTARSIYLPLRAAALARARRHWTQFGFASTMDRLAADSEGSSNELRSSGVSLEMIRGGSGGGWILSLRLSPEAAAILPPTTAIRVVDSGGLVWMDGPVDRFGGIDADWPLGDVSPVERLRNHSLTIDLR